MKSLFFYFICLTLLLTSGVALADPMPRPDSTYKSTMEEDFAVIGDSLIIHHQEVIQIKVTRPAERKGAYAIPEEAKDLTYPYRLNRMVGEEPDTTLLESYQWRSIKLLPPWTAPVLSGEKVTRALTFDPASQSFAYHTDNSPATQEVDSVWLFALIAFWGFWFFWLIRIKSMDENFHPFGWVSIIYYLLALVFLNLMATYQGGWWILAFSIIGIVGTLLLAWISPLRANGDEENILIFIIHGLVFLLACVAFNTMVLTEIPHNYFQLNLLLISYIACGKLTAWLLLIIGRWVIKGNKEATLVSRQSST